MGVREFGSLGLWGFVFGVSTAGIRAGVQASGLGVGGFSNLGVGGLGFEFAVRDLALSGFRVGGGGSA